MQIFLVRPNPAPDGMSSSDYLRRGLIFLRYCLRNLAFPTIVPLPANAPLPTIIPFANYEAVFLRMTELAAGIMARAQNGDPRNRDPAAAPKPKQAPGLKTASIHQRLTDHLRKGRKVLKPGSGQRDLDLELLRLFARGRRSSAIAMAGLSGVVAAIAASWVDIHIIMVWLSLDIAAIGLARQLTGKFLKTASISIDVARWRRRFILAEAAQGVIWAMILMLISMAGDPAARICVLVLLLLIAAMNATITASIPGAVYGALAPMALAILAFLRPTSFADGTFTLIALGFGTQLYFVLLARKLYATSFEALLFQGEKDELIAELEQAKANSDLARRRAEEANLAKSRFLATMSHELRTPLNAILGFSEVMKGELFGSHVVSSYKEYSNDIHSSGQHLLMLINEILDLSRIEAGRFELKEEPVALAHVVDDCRHLLSLRAKKRNITVEEAVEPALPRIWADERAVRQVALNLLSNAVKFTPQGGAIKIRIGWTAVGGQYFAVRDTGPGIPEEEIPIVMTSFGRGALAQKNAEEGSGLGLPIVKGLVELHGGAFTLKSKLHGGTEAIVIFPPERVLNEEANEDAETKVRRRSKREAFSAA